MRFPIASRSSTRLSLPIVLLLSATAFACNIPVFRYALERWKPDLIEIVVFHPRVLSPGEQEQIKQLGSASSEPKGLANSQVVLIDTSGNELPEGASPEHGALWQRVAKVASNDVPYVVVQGNHARGPFTCWQGTLAEAVSSDLLQSPARAEVAKRLTTGHSIVWLVILSSDKKRNETVLTELRESCKQLGRTIEMPEGIGLPGSELFSEVPLLLEFSILQIQRDDPKEAFLLNVAKGFQPGAFEGDEPMIIPVFGRGRALEVIPASQFSPSLTEDLTLFLCGACSCQVKEQNPGFDLLLSVDWDTALFGEGGLRPPPAKKIGEGQFKEPTLLNIPSGRK